MLKNIKIFIGGDSLKFRQVQEYLFAEGYQWNVLPYEFRTYSNVEYVYVGESKDISCSAVGSAGYSRSTFVEMKFITKRFILWNHWQKIKKYLHWIKKLLS